MIRDEKLERTIERAIQSAFVDFPNAGNGTVWPKTYKEPNEASSIAPLFSQKFAPTPG